MPHNIEKAFEKEYGKKKGDLIFYKWQNKHKDYCSHCKKRTEHIKHSGYQLCKHCGYITKDYTGKVLR